VQQLAYVAHQSVAQPNKRAHQNAFGYGFNSSMKTGVINIEVEYFGKVKPTKPNEDAETIKKNSMGVITSASNRCLLNGGFLVFTTRAIITANKCESKDRNKKMPPINARLCK
jgi:putative hemolysin